MKGENRRKVEYRYFEMSADSYVIGLLRGEEGQRWAHQKVDRLHLHNYMEIGCCYGGKGKLTIGSQSCRYGEQTLCLIPPNVPHVTCSEEPLCLWEYLVIDVVGFMNHMFGQESPDFVEKTVEEIHRRSWVLENKDCEPLENMVLALLGELREMREYYEESVKGLLLMLLMQIARMNLLLGSQDISSKDRGREMILPALDYISKCYNRDISIGSLAKLCCISETHFRRVFCAVMDITPAKYINFVRIFMACELLRKTDLTIREIGALAGFPTLSTFQRNFKSQTGVSPKLWRKYPYKEGIQEMVENAQFSIGSENIEPSGNSIICT